MSTFTDMADDFRRGLWQDLPVLRVVLGLCPVLAVSSSVMNSLGMGLATTFVLLCSNIAIALIKSVIPAKIRIPAYITVIASFVTVVDLLMNAFVHDLHKTLGIFIPLIVVNCLVLGRAEAFASKNNVIRSIADGLGMGIGFTAVIVVVGAIREFFGAGSLMGFELTTSFMNPAIIMLLSPGAFMVLGVLLAIVNKISQQN